MDLKTALRKNRIFQNTTKCAPRVLPTLNVERKFTLLNDSIVRLARINGNKPFLKHVYLGRRVIKDFYLLDEVVNDKNPRRYLLRMRNRRLEAKVETLRICKGTVFEMRYGKRFVKELFPLGRIQKLDDLEPPLNWMRTIREEWKLDGFKVVVDHTLFGLWLRGKAIYPQKPFCIGKVGLSTKSKKLDAQKMNDKLDEFLKRHHHIFPGSEGEVLGKLEAFEKWMHDHVEKMCRGVKTTHEFQRTGVYDD